MRLHVAVGGVLAAVLSCTGTSPPATDAGVSGSSTSSSSTSSSSSSSSSGGAGPWGTDLYTDLQDTWDLPRLDAVAIDRAYGVYVLGRFAGDAGVRGTPLAAQGPALAVASFAPDGALRWARSIQGELTPAHRALWASYSDDTGLVVVLATFSGTVTTADRTLTAQGPSDILVAGFSGDGSVRFFKRLGGAGEDIAGCIGWSGWVAGSFEGTMDVASGVLTSAGGRDGFVLHVSDHGQWGAPERWGGPDDEHISTLALLGTGELLVGGWFNGTLVHAGTTVAASAGRDAFIAALKTFGSAEWLHAAGGPGDDDVAAAWASQDTSRAAVLLQVTGPAALGTLDVPAAGSAAVALQNDGTLLHLYQPPVPVVGMVMSPSLRPGLVGTFSGTLQAGATTLTARGPSDGVLFTVGQDGMLLGARPLGGDGDDTALGLDVTGLGMVYVVGTRGGRGSLDRVREL